MKKFLAVFLFLTVMGITTVKTAQAEWFGFCYGRTTTKMLCTPAIPKPLDIAGYCKTWALSHGANMWGNHTATSTEILTAKQATKCDEIIGGGGTPPAPNSYQCFGEILCPGPTGDTSSISMEPAGGSVMAASKLEAAKKCVNTYSAFYLNLLKSHAGTTCYVQTEAVD